MFDVQKYLMIVVLIFVGISPITFSQAKDSYKVEIINVSDLEKIINENDDQALLINVWATWCAPCREEFPELVKLANDYSNKVRVVGISVDEKGDLDSKVIPFLKNQKASFQNYLLKVIDPEDFINALNEKWGGAIPATFIYDKEGNQKEMIVGKQTYEVFESAIKKVIN
ncbi:MAG: TlpA family protein disulfide reductase [bacterium]|nr:TlpA family protein disulfide reductase [bacterium]